MKIIPALLLLLIVCFSFRAAERKGRPPGKIKNVIVLGNSITYHGPAPNLGWKGAWGMGATSIDSDYVHRLIRQFRSVDTSIKTTLFPVGNWELNYSRLNPVQMTIYRDTKPDLIILKIGENVNDANCVRDSLEKHLVEYVNAIKPDPNTPVCLPSSFFTKQHVDSIFKATCEHQHWIFVDLRRLNLDNRNRRVDSPNPSVAVHPNDHGMGIIADRIWAGIAFLFT